MTAGIERGSSPILCDSKTITIASERSGLVAKAGQKDIKSVSQDLLNTYSQVRSLDFNVVLKCLSPSNCCECMRQNLPATLRHSITGLSNTALPERTTSRSRTFHSISFGRLSWPLVFNMILSVVETPTSLRPLRSSCSDE